MVEGVRIGFSNIELERQQYMDKNLVEQHIIRCFKSLYSAAGRTAAFMGVWESKG